MIDRLPERFSEPSPWLRALWDSWPGRWMLPPRSRPTREQLQACGRMLYEGDPVADRLAALDEEIGPAEARKLFERALDRGLAAVENPPEALVELMREVEEEPIWLDRAQLALGSAVCRRSGMLSSFILRDVALMGGYQSAALAKPLVFTGSLDSGVDGRLAETGVFWVDATRPGGLERFAPGRRTAVRVRVLHARLRRRIRKHPKWDDDEWGVPINQADLLATNQAFSTLFLGGLRLLGMRINREEGEAVMHLWRYVGTLLGIRPDTLPATEHDGLRTLYATTIHHPAPDADSRALAQALLNEPRGADRHSSWLAGEIEAGLHHGMSRFLLDRGTCDALGIEATPWQWVPPLVTLAVAPFEALRPWIPGATQIATEVGGLLQEQQQSSALAGRKAEFQPVDKLAAA